MVQRTKAGESLSAGVYAQLRIDILNRRLAPGERLKPAELARRLGVSVNVLREALALLGAQNLIRIERNHGFHAVMLTTEKLIDFTAARTINERAALRLAVERGGVGWESEIVAAHHRMARQPTYQPSDPASCTDDWAAAHAAFHSTLIEACGNQGPARDLRSAVRRGTAVPRLATRPGPNPARVRRRTQGAPGRCPRPRNRPSRRPARGPHQLNRGRLRPVAREHFPQFGCLASRTCAYAGSPATAAVQAGRHLPEPAAALAHVVSVRAKH